MAKQDRHDDGKYKSKNELGDTPAVKPGSDYGVNPLGDLYGVDVQEQNRQKKESA